MPISQNTALFSLLGTFYGGDGKSTFALPNLQGNVALHTDQYSGRGQYPLGSTSGDRLRHPAHLARCPSTAHTCIAATFSLCRPPQTSPGGSVPGNARPQVHLLDTTTSNVTMNPSMISIAGGSPPHNNMQPYLTLNYCIALQGVYPPRT